MKWNADLLSACLGKSGFFFCRLTMVTLILITKAQLNKLRWRCRRGTLELDVIFQRFLDTQYTRLQSEQQQTFMELLALEDDQLIHYFIENQ